LVPGKDIIAARFLMYLLWQGEMNRRGENSDWKEPPTWEIRITVQALAWYLRLDEMIKAKKRGGIRSKLTAFYKLGVKLGYIASHQGYVLGTKGRRGEVLKLNPSVFRVMVPSGGKSGTK